MEMRQFPANWVCPVFPPMKPDYPNRLLVLTHVIFLTSTSLPLIVFREPTCSFFLMNFMHSSF